MEVSMRQCAVGKTMLVALVAALAAIANPPEAKADFHVAAGWDLFTTDPAGTNFNGVPFGGVPLGTFDFDNTFGRGIGVQNVGSTDTIIQRTSDVITGGGAGSSGVTPLLMEALQLKSAVPTDFGLGVGFYFITLQSARGGPASAGTMTITFDGTGLAGTFSSSLDVFFDIRLGALNGPIAQSGDLVLTSIGTSWSNIPPANALEINGVNKFLDGRDRLQDFWPQGPVQEVHPNGAMHTANNTPMSPVPEPTSVALAALGAVLVGARALRKTGHPGTA
jgi:hypothetical protein